MELDERGGGVHVPSFALLLNDLPESRAVVVVAVPIDGVVVVLPAPAVLAHVVVRELLVGVPPLRNQVVGQLQLRQRLDHLPLLALLVQLNQTVRRFVVPVGLWSVGNLWAGRGRDRCRDSCNFFRRRLRSCPVCVCVLALKANCSFSLAGGWAVTELGSAAG